MKSNFKKSLDRVLVFEGGKVDHPKDPGGRTNQGITQKVYSAYRERKGLGPRDVYDMALKERDDIYKQQYWDPAKCDALPAGIDFAVFDFAVNSGVDRSVRTLQKAIGDVATDGDMGMVTLSRLMEDGDHDMIIEKYMKQRMAFLRHLDTWPTFGKGWSKRVAQVKEIAQSWASGSVGPEPVHIEDGNQKAETKNAKPRRSTAIADSCAGAGATITAGTQAVNEAKDSLNGLETFSIVPYIITGLTLLGLALVVAGIAYRVYVKRKNAERADALAFELSSK